MSVHQPDTRHISPEINIDVAIVTFFMFRSGCCTKHDVNVAVGIPLLESDVTIICIHVFLMLQNIDF